MSGLNVSLKDFWPVMKEVLESGGDFTFYPNGTSMMPLIREGVDQVILAKSDNYKVGDAVFYLRENGQFVLHRIVKIKNGEYVMCGDNQVGFEYGIKENQILAKMKALIRDGEVIDETNKRYRKYIRWLPFRRFKKRIVSKLRAIKNKLFGKKSK